MRWFLLLWVVPISFLLLWLGLASHDLHFGMFFFSRALYDQVFGIYGLALGLPPESLPPMVVRAIAVDSSIVLAIFAFRRRRQIAVWLRRLRQPASSSDATVSAASLSSAP